MSRIFLSTLAALAAAAATACGGAVEQPAPGDAPLPSSSTRAATAGAAPVGVWELVSLERTGGIAADVHDVLQMRIYDDGRVAARRCMKRMFEPGSVDVRCVDASSYDCIYGSVRADGRAWRLDLPDLDPSATSDDRGIVENDGARIKVRWILASSPMGTFVPVAESSAPSVSSAVANCRG